MALLGWFSMYRPMVAEETFLASSTNMTASMTRQFERIRVFLATGLQKGKTLVEAA
jgi:hypothetical protein